MLTLVATIAVAEVRYDGWVGQGGGVAADVACDQHYVVDSAKQPEVAVLISLRAIAGKVHARESAPVDVLIALIVAPDRAQHTRPGLLKDEVASASQRNRFATVVDDVGFDP